MCEKNPAPEERIAELEEYIEDLEDVLRIYKGYVENETTYLMHHIREFEGKSRGTPPSMFYAMRSRAEFSYMLFQLGQEWNVR